MTINLENNQVRFQADRDYFFACNLTGRQDVIDASATPRKFSKFVNQVQSAFTADTTMSQVWDIAIKCRIKITYKAY